jgi:mannosyltransferase
VSAGSLAQYPRRGPLTGGRVAGTRMFAGQATAAVVALTVLGAGLRFYGLGHQGFWFDEANTVALVHFSPGKMLGLIPQSESTPPLYYCVAWVWARIFGYGEAGLRSLSAVAGVLTIPLAYGAAAKLISRRAGVVTAALTACSPLLIWYSQEARSYELLVALTALSLLAFADARAAPTPRALTFWVVACALALATHYFAAVAIVPQAALLLYERRGERPVRTAVAIVALCGLALIPLAISQNGTGNDSWIAHAVLGARLRQIVPQFLIGTNAPDRRLLKDLAFALAVVALGLLAVRTGPAERRPALVAGGLALSGFALSLVLIVAGFDDLITRNIIALWLPAAILLAGGLAASRAPAIGAMVTVALCAIGIIATVGIATDRSLQRPDWRPVARVLGTAWPGLDAGGDRAILIQHYRALLPLSLYLHHLSVMRPAGVHIRELDVISITSPRQPLCWWGAACNLIPSQMQRRYDIAGLRAAGSRHVGQFTILELVSDRPVRVTPATVSPALRTTRLARDVLIVQRG